jgi:hypothetical protein
MAGHALGIGAIARAGARKEGSLAPPDELAKVTKPGVDVAARVQRSAEQALEDLQFRRKGLAVSLVVILIAIVSIYLKLGQIEGLVKKQS